MATPRFKERKTFVLSGATDSYAAEFITFGLRPSGDIVEGGLTGVTVMVESNVPGGIVELWLPKIGALDESDDFFYSGRAIEDNVSETFSLAHYPGAQIRVKDPGGAGGNVIVNASAD